MTTAQAFNELLNNLKVEDEKISIRYREITKKLNKTFRNTESETDNCFQVGSYGRYTGIKGISDLDMLYLMPQNKWDDYKSNPGQLLVDVRNALLSRYPNTEIRYDQLVVDVKFSDFVFEVQPVFETEENGERCFQYPDTRSGAYKITKPLQEQQAMTDFRNNHGTHHRFLCKIMRSWKNNLGVGMGGLLLDTLTYKFLKDNPGYDFCGTTKFDALCRDFFEYLMNQPKHDHYQALGSGQDVKVKHPFKTKSQIAYNIALKAIAETDNKKKHEFWREVFGNYFPKTPEMVLEDSKKYSAALTDDEEFVENNFPVDIRYDLWVYWTFFVMIYTQKTSNRHFS